MSRRALGVVLLVVGLATAGGGVVGMLTADGDDAEDAADTASSTPSPSTTATTVPDETPAEFFAELAASLATTDRAFAYRRLHPSVLTLYGADQCRTYLGAFASPQFEVVKVHPPAPWNYGARESRSIVIDDAIQVDAFVTTGDQRNQAETHLARADDGTLRWFTDCGQPQTAS